MAGVTTSGQQFLYNGAPITFRGINAYCDPPNQFGPDGGLGQWGPSAVLGLFPGINLVRMNSFSYPSVGFMQPIIAGLTAAGCFVEIEDHNYPTCLTGSALQQSANWYHAMAQAFAGNDKVLFGTQNEPDLSSGWGAVETELESIVNAVRGAGNSNLVFVCAAGGYTTSGLNGTKIKALQNVAWDLHFYNWLANNSTALQANVNALNTEVANAEATAALAPYIGEFGISSGALGPVDDPGGNQVVQAVQQSGLSSAAWAYTSGNASLPLLLNSTAGNPASGLTAFGASTAKFIATNAPPPPVPPTPPTGAATYCWPGVGSVTDGRHTYTVNTAGAFCQDGTPVAGGNGTSAGAVWGTTVYGQDAQSSAWFVWNGAVWTAAATPPPIPPLAPPGVVAQVVVNVWDQLSVPGSLTIPVNLQGA